MFVSLGELANDGGFVWWAFGIGNDETYFKIDLYKQKKERFFFKLTTLAAFDPEHVRSLSIHFGLSFASIAKNKNIYYIKKIEN
jgi:hypothetical protein